jgi:hypothetical protein
MKTSSFQLITNETNLRFLNLGFNIRDSMLCVLFASYLFKNERKPSKTPHTSLLMLDANNDNSKNITKSSLINILFLKF